MVGHADAGRDGRGVVGEFGGDENPMAIHVEWIGFDEPDVSVDAGAFIKPAFLAGGIHADGDDVVPAVIEKLTEVIAEAVVAAGFVAKVMSVDPDPGITVNAVAPSLIETDMVKKDLKVNPAQVPVGRFGTPEEVAVVVVMLAKNGYITGQTIYVNGGRYMT